MRSFRFGMGLDPRMFDPRITASWLLFWGVAAITADSAALLGAGLALLVIVSLVVGLRLRILASALAALATVVVQVVVMRLLFGADGLVAAGGASALSPAALQLELARAAGVGARLGLVLLAAMQFHHLTRPAHLTQVLGRAGLPHRWAALPGVALRLLPLMRSELRAVWDSQASRGLPVDGTRDRIRALLPVGLPFVYRSMRRANDLALAMELRGFGARRRATFLEDLRLSPVGRLAVFALLTAATALLVV